MLARAIAVKLSASKVVESTRRRYIESVLTFKDQNFQLCIAAATAIVKDK